MIKDLKQPTINEFRFKEFSNLDSSPDAEYLMASMDVMLSLESIRAVKQHAIASMQLKPGDSVLEVGCGTGEDAELIGQLVGDKGSVVAIDLSQRMINEAKRRSTQANVDYLVADASHLSCLKHSFSACHADRLLVSHNNYQAFFKEIVRVVKPAGVICFTDVDALSIVIHPFSDSTRVILEQLHQSFVNPDIGRRLPELFIQNGLQDVAIIPEISMIRSFETLGKIFQFPRIAAEAVRRGKLSKKEADQWFEDMHKAGQEGYFLYSIALFTVIGRVP